MPQQSQHRPDEVLLQLGFVIIFEDARLMFIKLFDFGESLRQARLLSPLRTVFDQLFQIVVGEQIAVLKGARIRGHSALGLTAEMIKVSSRFFGILYG